MTVGHGYTDQYLTDDEIREILTEGLDQVAMEGKHVVVIIPDSTRTAPIPLMFRLFNELLGDTVAKLDFLVALGTHPLMNQEALNRLVGITEEERTTTYADVGLYNHQWDDPETFTDLGTITEDEIETISRGMLSRDVKVTVNKMLMTCDQIIVCGPVFPHEVVGFSGGTKYFSPASPVPR